MEECFLVGEQVAHLSYLTSAEEEDLVNFLCRVAHISQGRTRQEVIAIVPIEAMLQLMQKQSVLVGGPPSVMIRCSFIIANIDHLLTRGLQ